MDAGSGPVQFPEYVSYSEGFEYRICVDFSFPALQRAKDKLNGHGIYILADITKLPLKDNIIDAAVSLHTVYHVPEDEQHKVFDEIHRTLKPSRTAVIAYSWGVHSFLMKLLFNWPRRILRLPDRIVTAMRKKKSSPSAPPRPELYFCPHTYQWFLNQKWKYAFDIIAGQSLSKQFIDKYIKSWFFGKQILELFVWLEEKFPHLMGRIGQYPLFVIRK